MTIISLCCRQNKSYPIYSRWFFEVTIIHRDINPKITLFKVIYIIFK